MNEETKTKLVAIEDFFKEAFVADTAEVIMLNRQQKKQFKIISVVKMTDKTRGTFYVASVYPK